MRCAWCREPVADGDDARQLPGTIYHASCWDRRCAVVVPIRPMLDRPAAVHETS
jgi:hypothetical protein